MKMKLLSEPETKSIHFWKEIGHFIVVYLVAKPWMWSKTEGDHVVIETSI